MSLPIVGSPDWKWLVIGILVAWFLIPQVSALLSRGRTSQTAKVKAPAK